MPMPWSGSYYGGYRMTHRRNMIARLNALGLLVELRTGPRNGKYWHTTELGDLFEAMVASGPKAFRSSFALLYG
jgi:hypothetical protein